MRRVVWLTLALFLSFLCVAMSHPVTSVYVSTRLGFSNALAGLAVGVPFASTIVTRGMAGTRTGFAGVMGASALVPLIGLAMTLPIAGVAPLVGERPSFWSIIGRIWEPGLVVGLQGVGFAAIGAFMPLLFLHRGWPHAGLGLTCFGCAFVLMRILFGHLPDRVGGIPVALVSLAVEAVGQYLLWTASGPVVGLAGAFLSGLGCSLIFPAMGVEAVRRIPPHLRGTAIGGFAAFQDLAYGVTGPATGLLADRFGYGVVFLIGGLAATLGFALVIAVARRDRAQMA